MAYNKTNWLDRAVEFVRRYRDQFNNQYTFTPDEGTIYEEGTDVNALNLNNIEDGIEYVHNAIEVPSYSTPVEETKEIIPLNSNSMGKFDATVKGNTVVNLLPDDVAGCESTTVWNTVGSSSIVTSTDKIEGHNSLEVTTTSSSSSVFGSYTLDNFSVDNQKYYLVSAFLKNDNSQSVALRITDTSVVEIKTSNSTTNTTFVRLAVVLSPSDLTGIDEIKLYFRGVSGGSGTKIKYDAIQLQEISANEYALGADALLENYAYHRGNKQTDKCRVKVTGKNLFHDDEFLNKATKSVATLTKIENGIKIKSNSANAFCIAYLNYKVKPNTTYVVSANTNRISGTTGGILGITRADGVNIGTPIGVYPNPENRATSLSDGILRIYFYATAGTSEIGEVDYTDIQLEEASVKTTYVPYTKTQATCPVKLRSVPAIQDEWNCSAGEITKNVKEYVLQSGDIDTLNTTPTNVDVVLIGKLADYKYSSTATGSEGATNVVGYAEKSYVDSTDNENTYAYNFSSGNWAIVVPKNTYASLAEAKTALAGTVIYYQLATPEISYTQPAILTAHANGTVYNEPYVAESDTAQFYSTGLVLDSNYPLSSLSDIDEINKYDLETGLVTSIDIADLTLASSTLITSASATDGEFYAVSYNYRNLSTIGTVEHNFGTNLKAQTNDNTEGLKLLDAKVNRNIIETDIKIDNHKKDLLPHFDYAYETDYIYDGSGNITVVDYSVASVLRRKDTITYSGVDISTVNIKVYDLDGTTILEEYTDTITYSGDNITNIARSVIV